MTTGAVVEGALRLVGSHAFGRVRLRDHLVVGVRRLGATFVAALRLWQPALAIVAVGDIGQAVARP
jgi:hypothetical protein